jgi:chitodextrinase
VKKLVFLFALLLVGVASAAPTVVSTTQTSATLEGLDCGSKYRFEIRKYTANGELSSTADSVDAQTKSCTDTQPPSAPQSFAATGRTQTSISVSWSASADDVGVTGYHVYRGRAKVDSTTATSYTFSALSCGTSYALAVEAYDTAGNRSAASEISASTAACPPPSCRSGEYSARYYGNMTLSGTPLLQRCETAIDHGWGSGSPTGVPADGFSTRWTGTHSFTGGSYEFTATADDGIRVWVDGTLLIDAWKDQPLTTYRATRTLTAGDHVVKVEYYENAGGAGAKVGWQLSQLPTPPPGPESPPLVWKADMEEGSLADWFYPEAGPWGAYGGGEYNDASGDSVASTTQAQAGSWSAKMVLPLGAGATRLFRWKEPRERGEAYYTANFFFPQRYSSPLWWNIFQFKSRTSSANDPFWVINVGNRGDGSMYLYLYDWINRRTYSQSVANLPVGRWVEIKAYLRQSSSGLGRLTVWQDGTLLWDLTGISTKYADGDQQWSVNSYTDGVAPAPVVMYVDNASISVP